MFTGNIKAQGMGTGQANQTSKASAQNGKTGKTSFDDFMNSSGKDTNYVKTDESNTKEITTDNSTKIVPKKNEENVSDAVKNLAKALLESQKEDTTAIEDDSAILESMTILMTALQNTIAQTLNISEDTLKQAMEELGFENVDLFDTDNLKQLVLFLNESQDVTDLLTDEDLGNSLQELLQNVEQFKADNNLTDERIVKYEQLSNQANITAKEIIEPKDGELNTEPKIVVIKEEGTPVLKENKNEESPKDNSSENSHKNMQNLSAADAFIQNLSAKPLQESELSEPIFSTHQMQEITDQIVEQIKITINPSQTSMELQLNPENLGKVNLSVVYKDGVMTAHFTAQNEAVKEAIESQMQVLKDNFMNQGLKVEAVEVTVSNFSFEGQSSGNTGKEPNQPDSRNRSFRFIEDVTVNDESETVIPGILDENTSSVDIIA